MAESQSSIIAHSSVTAVTQEPGASEAINALLEFHPGDFGLTHEDFEAIEKGEGLFYYQQMVIDTGEYLDKFLACLGWWMRVSRVLPAAMDYTDDAIAKSLAGIVALLPAANTAPVLALADCGSDPTGMEMVFREMICSQVAKEVSTNDAEVLRKLL